MVIGRWDLIWHIIIIIIANLKFDAAAENQKNPSKNLWCLNKKDSSYNIVQLVYYR